MRSLTLSLLLFFCLHIHAEISITNLVDCVCEDQATQAFFVVATGTAGPFTFEWVGPDDYTSTEQNPSDITSPGEYIVEVTNAYGCVLRLSGELPACPGIESLEFEVQPDCGGAGGNILTTVTGGAPGLLDYQWTNDQNPPGMYYTPNLYNVPFGLYSLTVTDQHGCTATGEAEIEDNSGIPTFSVDADVQHACTPNNGRIKLDLSEVQEPFEITWSYPNSDNESILQNLAAGFYSVTVTDVNGCSVLETYRVGGRPMVNATVTPATCNTTNDGSIELQITGAPIESIVWSDGVTGETHRTGLAPDQYTVTITTRDGCVYTPSPYQVRPTEAVDIYPYLKRVSIGATGAGISEIIYDGYWVPASGGCLVFMGGTQNISTEILDAMALGNVELQVNALFSEAIGFGTVGYTSVTGTSGGEIFNIIPEGDIYGFIISGGTVQSMISDGLLDLQLTYSAFDLAGNEIIDLRTSSSDLTQCVTIPGIDPATCDWSPSLGEITIGPDPTHRIELDCYPLEIVAVDDEYFCIQSPDGSVPTDLIERIYWDTPTGPAPTPFTYCFPISDGAYGEYCATVKLRTGCAVELCATYCDRPLISNANSTLDHPTCPGTDDGGICFDFESSSPVILDWGNGNFGNCIEGLSAGEYCVTLTAANCDVTDGFPKVNCFVLEGEEGNLTYSASITPTCDGGGIGAACVYPEGGVPPYIFSWDDGIESNCIDNLPGGTYPFTIIDDCGSIIQDVVIVEDLGNLELVFEGIIPLFPSPCEPYLSFSIDGTYPGENYTAVATHLSTGTTFVQSSNDYFLFQSILAGDYEIAIQQQCGEALIINLTAEQFPVEEPTISVIQTIETCPEMPSGEIELEISGLGAPYTAVLNGSYTSEIAGNTHTFSDLPPDTYDLSVTDRCGNLFQSLIQIEISALDKISVVPTIKPTCLDESTGIIDLAITYPAGNSSFTYEWNNGATGSTIENLVGGTYTVTITGMPTGCQFVREYEVDEREIVLENQFILGESNHPTIGPLQNGFIELFFNEEIGNLSFDWSTGDSSNPLENLSSGSYSVTVSDDYGCSNSFSFEVPFCQYNGPSINLEETAITTTQAPAGGSIVLAVDNQNEPMTYQWEGSNGFTSNEQNIYGLIETGEYCVTVTDACFNYDSFCFELIESCDPSFGSYTNVTLNSVNNCMDEESGDSHLIVEGIHTYGNGIYDNELWSLVWSTGDEGVVRLGSPSTGGGGTYWNVTQVLSGTDRIEPIMLQNGDPVVTPYDVGWGTSRVFTVTLIHQATGCTLIASAEFSNNNATTFNRIHGCFPVSGLSSLFSGVEDMYITDGSTCLTCGFEQTGNNPPFRYCNESTTGLTLKYYPDANNNPDAQNVCQMGGELRLEGESSNGWPHWVPWSTNEVSIVVGTVLGNSTAIHFDDGGLANCGCLFPPGEVEFTASNLVLPENCLGTAYVFASDPSCNDDGNDGPPVVNGGGGLEEFLASFEYAGCDEVEIEYESGSQGECLIGFLICSEGEREGEVIAGPFQTASTACRCVDLRCPGHMEDPMSYKIDICVEGLLEGECPIIVGDIPDEVTPLPLCDECVCNTFIQDNGCMGFTGDDPGSLLRDGEVGSIDSQLIIGDQIGMRVFPNPTSQKFSVEVALLQDISFSLELTNLLGKRISNHMIEGIRGKSIIEMSFSDNVKAGIYLLKLRAANGEEITTKISLIR